MRLHRALLDRQPTGDLLVEQAFGEQGEHAGLLFGEAGEAAGEVGVGRVGGQGGHRGIERGRQPAAAIEHGANRLADLRGAGALGNEAGRAVIEHAPDPVALFSASGKVLVENPPMALLRGKALPVDVPEAMRQGEIRDEIVTDAGRRILTRYATPVTDGEGRPIGRLVALRDVTAEREADRLKDEFFALVSHELRTPLTSMLGYLDLVRDEELSEDATEFVDVIERNALRLQRVVGDLLFVARFEAGHIPILEAQIDMRPLCDEAIAAALPAADRADVHLQLDADRSGVLSADRDRLGQVVDNLVNNAIKFTPSGGDIVLRLRDRGDSVVVEVVDSGEGIDPDEIDNIFKRFYRSGRVVRRAVPGAGLGLTIVRSIVEAHGGTIRVTSRLGRGSTFTVTNNAASSGTTVAPSTTAGVYKVGAGAGATTITVTWTVNWPFGTTAPSSNTTGENAAKTGVVSLSGGAITPALLIRMSMRSWRPAMASAAARAERRSPSSS